jgi:transposase
MLPWYPVFMKVAPEVHLSVEERNPLRELTRKGEASARKIKRALILLRLDALRDGRAGRHSNSNATVAAEYGVCARTVSRLRQRYVQDGLEAALAEETRPGRPVEITGEMEAKLVMLACSDPPEGRDRWTLQLLADRMVALEYAPHLSDTEVHNRLKKTSCTPGKSKAG